MHGSFRIEAMLRVSALPKSLRVVFECELSVWCQLGPPPLPSEPAAE